MGRKDSDEMSAAQIFYPCMQCADVFFLKADICQLGMDQRKVNMLAREYAADTKRRFKPVIISHHMLMGLKEGQEKMSKSDPDSAIFMEDTAVDVARKIKKSYCPPEVKFAMRIISIFILSVQRASNRLEITLSVQIIEKNPIIDYARHIVIGYYGKLVVNLSTGPTEYTDANVLEADYAAAKIHPSELKPAVTEAINLILEPVRKHFETGEPKKLLDKIKKFKVTR